MKQKLFFAFVVTLCCSFILKPFEYNFESVDPLTGGMGTKPEKTTATIQRSKAKTTSNSYTITGTKSTIRLKIKETIFNAYPGKTSVSLDPSLYIFLFKVSPGKTDRTFTMNADGSSVMMIPLTITKPDATTIRINPSVAMLPGEYAFIDKTTTTAEGNIVVWTFGID